tara:strand:- start:116 stop:382 length:267 start_codon:yes stop_codon:yes gene_type:complete
MKAQSTDQWRRSTGLTLNAQSRWSIDKTTWRLSVKVGDLVKVGHIGIGIVTAVWWDYEEVENAIRIQFADGTWSLENESIVELINGNR